MIIIEWISFLADTCSISIVKDELIYVLVDLKGNRPKGSIGFGDFTVDDGPLHTTFSSPYHPPLLRLGH